MNIDHLNLKAISHEDMLTINGGTDQVIDTNSFAYQLGYTVGQAIRNAATVAGLVALFCL